MNLQSRSKTCKASRCTARPGEPSNSTSSLRALHRFPLTHRKSPIPGQHGSNKHAKGARAHWVTPRPSHSQAQGAALTTSGCLQCLLKGQRQSDKRAPLGKHCPLRKHSESNTSNPCPRWLTSRWLHSRSPKRPSPGWLRPPLLSPNELKKVVPLALGLDLGTNGGAPPPLGPKTR